MGKRRRTDEEGAGQEAPDAEGEEEEEANPYKNDTALSMLKFRNYVPRDKHLRYFMLARPEVVPDIDMEALCQPLSEKNGERTPHPHNRLGPPTTFPHRRTCCAPDGLPCSVAPSPMPAQFLAAARLCERCVCLCRHHARRHHGHRAEEGQLGPQTRCCAQASATGEAHAARSDRADT
eukprot:COSAG01_NODE_9955_length_2293_cov_1.919781_2_plen_178_part_00